MRALSDKKDGDVQLTIVRDRSRQTISVTPELSKDGGFFFQTDGDDDDDEGMMPPMPGRMKMVAPAVPAAPVIAPAPMTFVHPARAI